MDREDDEMDGQSPEAVAAAAEDVSAAVQSSQPEASAPARTFGRAAPMLFGAFVLLSIVAAGVYLTKRQLAEAPAASAPDAAASENAPPPVFEIPDPAGTPLAGYEPPGAKISNDFGDDLKSAADAAEITSPGSVTELPPPPVGHDGGLGAMQDAAKEAAKLFSPKNKAPADIDLSAPGAAEALETLERAAEPAESSVVDTPTPNVSPDQTSALKLDVARLEGGLAAERQHTERQSAEIARLGAELERIQREGSPLAREARRALLFAKLERDAASGAPFAVSYDAYAAIGGDIAALEPFTDAGLPRLAGLKNEFPALARDARAAARRAHAKDPFAKLAANLANLVNLRPAGPHAGDDAVAVLSRAEASLARDDLAAALEDLGALNAAARAPLSAWIAKASARIETEKALAARSASILSAFSAETATQ